MIAPFFCGLFCKNHNLLLPKSDNNEKTFSTSHSLVGFVCM